MSLVYFLLTPAWAVDATVWSELGRVTHLQAEFSQTQTRKVLKTPLTSTGSLEFTRPGQLTWTVRTPYASTFSLTAGVARMTVPSLQVDQTIDLNQVPDAGRLAASLMVWLQADATAVDRDFSVHYGASDATLEPRDSRLAGLLASIHLDLVANPWRVKDVTLTEPSGDHTDIRFSSVTLDGVRAPEP